MARFMNLRSVARLPWPAALLTLFLLSLASNLKAQTMQAWWKLNDGSGSSAADYSGTYDTGTLIGGYSWVSGPPGGTGGAVQFDGSSGYLYGMQIFPGTSTFTLDMLFNTTTSIGGLLIGFGSNQTGLSASYDRHIYMDSAGHIWFGVFNGAVQTIESPNSYNDGLWHQVQASLAADGMNLYIDGVLVSSDPAVTSSTGFSGYWRLGYDNLNGWPNQPSSSFFKGSISDARVYTYELTSYVNELTPSNTGLSVLITTPTANAIISGITNISGTMSESISNPVGMSLAVSVDNIFVGWATTTGNGAWSFSLNTSNLSNGPHTIAVDASDISGNNASSSVSVTINNPRLTFWAADDSVKVTQNPDSSGNPIFVLQPGGWTPATNFTTQNDVWNQSSNLVSVAGAGNETVAFQIFLQNTSVGAANNINVKLTQPCGSAGCLGSASPNGNGSSVIHRFREWYIPAPAVNSNNAVWNIPEPLIPFRDPYAAGGLTMYSNLASANHVGAPFSISQGDIQAVWVDVHIPQNQPAGNYAGTITIASSGTVLGTINMILQVWNGNLPNFDQDPSMLKTWMETYTTRFDNGEACYGYACTTQSIHAMAQKYQLMGHYYDLDINLDDSVNFNCNSPALTDFSEWNALNGPSLTKGGLFPDGTALNVINSPITEEWNGCGSLPGGGYWNASQGTLPPAGDMTGLMQFTQQISEDFGSNGWNNTEILAYPWDEPFGKHPFNVVSAYQQAVNMANASSAINWGQSGPIVRPFLTAAPDYLTTTELGVSQEFCDGTFQNGVCQGPWISGLNSNFSGWPLQNVYDPAESWGYPNANKNFMANTLSTQPNQPFPGLSNGMDWELDMVANASEYIPGPVPGMAPGTDFTINGIKNTTGTGAAPVPFESWYYQAADPFTGNAWINGEALGMRDWAWVAARYNVNGIYYWADDFWGGYYGSDPSPGQPQNDPYLQSAGGSQDGVIFYPGAELPDTGNYLPVPPTGQIPPSNPNAYSVPAVTGPVASIRLAMWRRGYQDYMYQWLLQRSGNAAAAKQIVDEMIQSGLDARWQCANNTCAYNNGAGQWSHSPLDYDAARRTMAQDLGFTSQSVSWTPPYTPSSVSPTIYISTPANGGDVSGVLLVSGTAYDPVGVAQVFAKISNNQGYDFYDDVWFNGGAWSIGFDSTLLSNGPHTLTVVATDQIGNLTSSSMTIIIQNAGIAFSISTPTANMILTGTTPVSGIVSDTVISGSSVIPVAISSIAISVDGTFFGLAAGTSTWTYNLNTAAILNGTHTITAEVWDVNGASATASVPVVTSHLGMMAWWKLNQGSGSTAYDSSGMGDIGILTGGYSWGLSPPGGDGGSIQFDGASGYLDGTEQFVAPQVFTLDMVFKTTTTAGGVLMSLNGTGGQSPYALVCMSQQGNLILGVTLGGENGIWSSPGYNDGVWHQVQATLAPDGAKIYIDGVLQGSNAAITSLQTPDANSEYWGLSFGSVGGGYWNACSSSHFAGSISDARVYSYETNVYELVPSTVPPQITISSPVANATVSGNISILGTAFSSAGISKVQVSISSDSASGSAFWAYPMVNGQAIPPPVNALASGTTSWSYPLNTTDLLNGTYTITATAWDATGSSATVSSIFISSNNTAPSLAIITPIANTMVSGTIVISGTAFDNVAISTVDISIDGGTYRVAIGTANWSFTVNTTLWSNGNHTIGAYAYDPAGRESCWYCNITVTSSNTLTLTQSALWWKMNEGSGSTVFDYSGNYDTGTLNGGYSWLTTGLPSTGTGGAVQFDGSSGYLSEAFGQGSPDLFTQTLQFKTATTSGGILLGFGVCTYCSDTDRLLYMDNAGHMNFAIAAPGGLITSSAAYNDGNWHSAAASLASDGIKLYVDAVLVSSNAAANSSNVSNYGGQWFVGTDAWGLINPGASSRYFNGAISDVRVYNSELSPSQIGTTNSSATPSIAISAPTNNAVVFGTITISGLAADTNGVALSSVAVAIDTGPYQTAVGTSSWVSQIINTNLLSNSTHTVTAEVIDSLGNIVTTSIVIKVHNVTSVPTVAITWPISGATLSGVVNIAGTALETGGSTATITSVSIAIDTGAYITIFGTSSWSYSLNTFNLSNSTHSFNVKAVDSFGNIAFDSIMINVNNALNTPLISTPTISITSPLNGATVSGIVSIYGTSADSATITSVGISIDGGSYLLATGTASWTYVLNASSLTNGAHSISAEAMDINGNTAISSITINVFNIGPSVFISTPVNNAVVSGTVTISGTAMETVGSTVTISSVAISINGSPYVLALGTASWSYLLNTSTMSNGSYTITVKATDANGNFASSFITVTVFNGDPTVLISTPTNNAVVGGTITVSGTALQIPASSSPISEVQVSFDSGPYSLALGTGSWNYTLNLSTFQNGNYILSAEAIDTNNDVGTSSITIHVFNGAPLISISSPTNNAVVAGTITISGTSAETAGSSLPVSNVQIQIDSGPYSLALGTAAWNYTLNTASMTNGTHSIDAEATDANGNISLSSITIHVLNFGPAVFISTPADNAVVSGTITLSGTALETAGSTVPIVNVQVQIDTQPYALAVGTASWNYLINTALLNDGPNIIHVKVTDADGNTDILLWNLFIFNGAPSVSITYPADNAVVSGTITITGTAMELATSSAVIVNIVNVQISIDSGPFSLLTGTSSWSYTLNTSSIPNGAYVVTAKATDNLGDTAIDSINLNVDNVIISTPLISILSPAPGTVISNSTDIFGTAAEVAGTTATIAQISISIDSGPYTYFSDTSPWAYPLDTLSLVNSTHVVTAKATDTFGFTALSSITVIVYNYTNVELAWDASNIGNAIVVLISNNASFPFINSITAQITFPSGIQNLGMSLSPGPPLSYFVSLPTLSFNAQDFFAPGPSSTTIVIGTQTFTGEFEPREIDPNFGGAVIDSSGAEVLINSGQISAPAEITINSDPPDINGARAAALTKDDLSSLGSGRDIIMLTTGTLSSAQLTLPYQPALIPSPLTSSRAVIAYFNTQSGNWEVMPQTAVNSNNSLTATVTHFSIYKPALALPTSSPGLIGAYVFPNPAVTPNDPTIRVCMGIVNSVGITIFDITGRAVHSATLNNSPYILSGTNTPCNTQYTYDYTWTGNKASGVYFAVIHGHPASGHIVKARVKFAVVR